MWTSLATTAIKVAGAVLNPNSESPESNKGHNYNIRGHINNLPVDVAIERGAHSSSSYSPPLASASQSERNYPSAPVHQVNVRSAKSYQYPAKKISQPHTTCCNNCDKKRDNKTKPQKTDEIRKNDKFCLIKMPDNGNFEVTIKKTDSQFANMNMTTSKGSQHNQKSSVPNVSQKRFDGNRRQQNVNQTQQNVNQKKQNGNQDKGYRNPKANAQFSGYNGDKNKDRDFNKNKSGAQNGNKYQNQKLAANNVRNFQRPGFSNSHSTWMYLGRLKIGTTEGDIRSYLTAKFPQNNFKIEALPLYRDGKLPCFKVQVDNTILDEFQDLEHWPDGVKITKYHDNFKK